MIFNNSQLIPFAQFESLNTFQEVITHFITTRNHELPPSSNNHFTIGLNGDVGNDTVLMNRKNLADQFRFSNSAYVFASQVHDKMVAIVKEEDRGKGAFDRSSYLSDIDAMVTNLSGICLVTQAADCVPILFYDPVKRVIGAAHAGWKGTVAKIPAEVVKVMQLEYGTNPADILAGIGPSVGPCCYEVGDEVVSIVSDAFGTKNGLIIQNGKFPKSVFDLWEANKRTLIEAGLKSANIELSYLCSKCHNNFFFSARAGDNGRYGAGIIIKDKSN